MPDLVLDFAAPAAEVAEAVADVLRARPGEADCEWVGEVAFSSGDPNPVRIRLTPSPVAQGGSGTRVEVEAEAPPRVPYFGWFVRPVVRSADKRALRWVRPALTARLAGEDLPPLPRRPALAPPAAFAGPQAVLLATVCAIVAVATYGGSLLSQNVGFVADSFGADDQALGTVLAISRAGILLALVATALADRRGRRRLLLLSFAGVCLANAVAALAPNLAMFTVGQMIMRGAVNTALTVAAVAAIEEAPDGARAYSLSLMGLAGGAGYALGVLLLPLADIGLEAWRISFAISAVSILFLPRFARNLAETRRYAGLAARGAERGRVGEVFDANYGKRFGLLVAAGFFFAIFSAPTSQLTNKYLEDVRDFSAVDITVFRAITQGIPGVVGVMIGGRLAETKGRRPVAAIALLAGTLAEIVFLLTSGISLWLASAVAIILAGVSAPALGAFSGELFPTEIRGTANALLLVAGVLGSVAGLLTVGALSDRMGLGQALAVMGIPALIAAAFIIPRLPEPAARSLEDVSPSEV